MAFHSISRHIDQFVHAAEAGELALWLVSLSSSAAIYRNGLVASGKDVSAWLGSELAETSWSVRMQGRNRSRGQLTFRLQSLGNQHNAVTATTWRLSLNGNEISRIDIRTDDPIDLAPAAACFVDAVNRADEAAILSLFLNDAVVNDELVEHRGSEEIGQWIRTSVLGNSMGLEVVDAFTQDGSVSLRVEAWGDFGPGLPEPLVLTLYFSMSADFIAQLIVLQRPFPD